MTRTTRTTVELADIFGRYGPEFVSRFGAAMSPEQRKAMVDIERCRTAVLGGHKEECDSCRHERYAYNWGFWPNPSKRHIPELSRSVPMGPNQPAQGGSVF